MYRTMARIVMANRAHGHHWFDAEVMAHWGTRLTEITVDAGEAGTVFLVSDESSEHDGTGKHFRPCLSKPDGSVGELMWIYSGPADMIEGARLCDVAVRLLRAGMDRRGVRARLAEMI